MDRKKIQKIIYFSSSTNKYLIESILEDETETSKRYISNLMEEHLLSDILPKNERSAFFARMLYSDPPAENGNIRFTLVALFNNFSSLCNLDITPDNAHEIIEYSRYNFLGAMQEHFIIDENVGNYMIDACDSVIQRLEFIKKTEKIESQNQLRLSQDINNFKSIIRGGYEDWGRDYTCFVFSCIDDNWEYLSNDSYTYRLLASLTSLIPLQETSDERLKLLNLLKQINHWSPDR
jgi:hypothetical protein